MYKIKIDIHGCNNFTKLKKFIIEKNIKTILFSETHGMLNEIPIQEKIIQELKPIIYLYELLEEEKIKSPEKFNYFLNQPDFERFSLISTFGDLKPTIRLAEKYNLNLIGCDIKDMARKDKNFKEIEDPSEQKIMKLRELRQLESIKKALDEYNGLIFVSLGAFHLRKNSDLINEFSHNSLIIFPLINNKTLEELETIPEENDVRYVIMHGEEYKND